MSEVPPPPETHPGEDEPFLQGSVPGPTSRSWLVRASAAAAPMGPHVARSKSGTGVPSGTIVYATAKGSNVIDVDGNRYVDLCAGFGALLLGHAHPSIVRVIGLQAQRLLQALGDVHPADARIALSERLARLYPGPKARVILGQSGADAVTAALKTAMLFTGRPGIIAFRGAYHGLSYAPLAALGLREGYRTPFSAQLNPSVRFVEYPENDEMLERCLEQVRFELARGDVGALLVEPILGRGGCVVPPAGFMHELARLAVQASALVVADEIWTGLGRSGRMLFSTDEDCPADLICLGKGLGGGLPVSACLGREEVMLSWRRDPEVVHTSTFAGAPLGAATAIATLDVLSRERLVERSAELGTRFLSALAGALAGLSSVRGVRGAGLMVGIELAGGAGSAVEVSQALLREGYIVSTGGGRREVIVLTPPLTIAERLLFGAVPVLESVLRNNP